MAVSHTPGPWRIDPSHIYDVESADGHFQIAMIRDEQCGLLLDRQYAPTPGEAEANARLIAAAPDLLEALRAVVRVADRNTIEFDMARTALAKADGRADG